jgi:hypothetical protein
VFEIQIMNHAAGASATEVRLTLDGQSYSGNLITLNELNPGTHQVLAEIHPLRTANHLSTITLHEQIQSRSDTDHELQPIHR